MHDAFGEKELEGQTAGTTKERSERRQLTVMFCDLMGSTALSDNLDPEDYAEVLHAYHECCADVIHDFDGTISQYLGDGLRILFGYPLAHEDDPERAVRAGLAIIHKLGGLELKVLPGNGVERLHVRIGIATGIVVVGDFAGAGSTEEMAVFGDTPNLAARLQSLAQPDTVVVSPTTKQLLGNVFVTRDLGTLELKGFSAPVHAWQVLEPASVANRFELTHAAKLTAMVNRQSEFQRLNELWRDALNGAGQAVYITGDAGIGKSRLVREIAETLGGDDIHVFSYQCSRYYVNSSLFPVLSQIRRSSGDQTSSATIELLEQYLLSKVPTAVSIAPFIANLLSLQPKPEHVAYLGDPQKLKRDAFDSTLTLVRRLAEEKPVLIIVEDVHWLDPTSGELLALLREGIGDARVMLLLTARPEFPIPTSTSTHIHEINLRALDDAESFEIAGNLVDVERFPRQFIDKILEKTEGKPLFIEELFKSTLEHLNTDSANLEEVLPEIAIPSSLQDSLSSRLDRLGAARQSAQVAAVIGREFSRNLLALVTERAQDALNSDLETLLEADILYRHADGDDEHYVFRHALIQDAAYDTLLRKNRRRLHARIAEMLEHHYPDKTSIEPEVLAHHYSEAEMPDAAVNYWALAAKRALLHSANEELISYANQGRALLRDLETPANRDKLELDFLILLGAAYRATKGFSSSEVEESFSRAYELCEKLDDHAKIIDVLRGLFACYYVRAQHGKALQQADLVLAKAADMPDVSMMGHWMRGCTLFWQGRFVESGDELFNAIALYEQSEQPKQILATQIDPGVNAYIHLIWNRWIVGKVDEAVSISEYVIALARELNQPFALAMALQFICTVRIYRGELDLARSLSDELQQITKTYNIVFLHVTGQILDGFIDIESDNLLPGEKKIDAAWQVLHRQDAFLGEPWSYSILVTRSLRHNNFTEGLELVERALASCEKNGENHWIAEIYRLKGELLLAQDAANADAAMASLQQAMNTAAGQGARSLQLRAASSIAKLLDMQNKASDALQIITVAYELFDEGHDTQDLRAAQEFQLELQTKTV
jgi:class 3 adenylate cyclase